MPTTITRGTTVLHPSDVLGWSMSRGTRAVLHEILGDPRPDVTTRTAASWSGRLRTYWPSRATAKAAADALALGGGPWTFATSEWPELTLVAQVIDGELQLEASRDGGGVWLLTVPVREVS